MVAARLSLTLPPPYRTHNALVVSTTPVPHAMPSTCCIYANPPSSLHLPMYLLCQSLSRYYRCISLLHPFTSSYHPPPGVPSCDPHHRFAPVSLLGVTRPLYFGLSMDTQRRCGNPMALPCMSMAGDAGDVDECGSGCTSHWASSTRSVVGGTTTGVGEAAGQSSPPARANDDTRVAVRTSLSSIMTKVR